MKDKNQYNSNLLEIVPLILINLHEKEFIKAQIYIKHAMILTEYLINSNKLIMDMLQKNQDKEYLEGFMYVSEISLMQKKYLNELFVLFDLTPTNAKEAEIKQEFSKLMTITNLFYTQLEELIILADERLWDLQFEQNPQVLTRLSEEAKNEISIGKIKDILC